MVGASPLSLGRSAVRILAESYQRLKKMVRAASLLDVRHLKRTRTQTNNRSEGLMDLMTSCIEVPCKRTRIFIVQW